MVSQAGPRFTPVDMVPAPFSASDPVSTEQTRLAVPSSPGWSVGLIEIRLPNGVSLRVDADVDSRALRRVLSALDSR